MNEYGENGKTKTTVVFYYDNGNYENAYQQWAPFITGGWLDQDYEAFLYAGLLGVGPAMLPSSGKRSIEYYKDGEWHASSWDASDTYRYGFNDDGSISYTKVNSQSYNFTYDNAKTGSTRSGH